VDGGAAENTPLHPALRLGARELHVIDINPPTKFIPISAQANTLETMLRVYYVLLATKLHEDMTSISWINGGIRALQRLRETGQLSATDEFAFIRGGGRIVDQPQKTFKTITVHHYFPQAALGGDLDMLDFSDRAIKQLIRLGEHEALIHDCTKNGCVL
jgi:predicted patatin/cPLA2 family phospholipase